MISRISVVYLYVTDLERSLAFYRDVLGLPLERHPHDEHWAEVAFANGTRFALHVATHRPPRAPATVEVSFEVDDLEGALERARRGGVEPVAVMDERWGSLATVVDPDGYEVGLFAPPRLPVTGAA